jgi:hypothetical protein
VATKIRLKFRPPKFRIYLSLYRLIFDIASISTKKTQLLLQRILFRKLTVRPLGYFYICGKRTVSAFQWYKGQGVCDSVIGGENAFS